MGQHDTEEVGKIRKVRLGIEGHGIFTFFVEIEFDGTTQSFGSYGLDSRDAATEKRVGRHGAIPLLRSILEAAEVGWWEDLPGKIIRVRRDGGLIRQIGHAYKNKWSLDPRKIVEPAHA